MNNTNQTANKHAYGYRRGSLDIRDHIYQLPAHLAGNIPEKADLRSMMPSPYDQGDLGSCTANAIGAAYEYELKKQGLKDFMPSRLFIYYNERVMENSVNSDAGAEIRDGVKSINKQGVCRETTWKYVISKFTRQPTKKAFTEALKHCCLKYESVPQTEESICGAIAAGLPVVFGVSVYESFESANADKTGNIPLPIKGEKLLGGHAIVLTSYDKQTRRFGFLNSWGASWGDGGFGTFPFDYVLNPDLADDFWTINLIST